MSTRYISIEEINSVLAAIEDKDGIELLKKIKDNINKEEDSDRKEAQKFESEKGGMSPEEQQKRSDKIIEKKAFVGFAKEEDIGIKDPEGKDVGKLGLLQRLEDKGLILKGGYIARDKPRVNSYKLTNEGYALLNLVERVKGAGQKSSQEEEQPSRQRQQQQEQEQQRTSSRR